MLSKLHRKLCCALIMGVLAGTVPARAEGVRLEVFPETLTVAPGDTFTVQLSLPVAGSAFNGFAATLEYDPAALRFLLQSQAVQEGPLLRAYCSNTFYLFGNAADSLQISDTMLCAGHVATGPGTLLALRFVALGPPGMTAVRVRRSVFYNDGLYVRPVLASDGVIAVGGTLGVPTGGPASIRPRLRAVPNPARGTCLLRIEGAPAEPGRLIVLDVLGRTVRRLDGRNAIASWDGRDDFGRTAPAGVYSAQLQFRDGILRTTFVRLP